MAARTSVTHPLIINDLELGQGRLGLTFCPGKKQRSGQTGSWDRDLGLDLARVREWGARAVVSAITLGELTELGVPELPEAVEALGLDWYHVPIRDWGVPDWRAEARWSYARPRLERVLEAGGGVVIHCMGGLGRTGTLAARLLVDRGVEPAEAIRTVRATRPGAIENPQQESWVGSSLPGRPVGVELSFEERLFGCLVGGAVGDAFGYCVEFMSLEAIRKGFGEAGLVEPNLADGRLVASDDSQMTLFTAEGLLCARAALAAGDLGPANDSVWTSYQSWLKTQGAHTSLDRDGSWLGAEQVLCCRRAPGNTCLSALGLGRPGTGDDPVNTSKGCGGVMRVAPVGLVPGWLDVRQAFELGARTAALTHGHPAGYHSAGALAALIRRLLDGWTVERAAREALALVESEPHSHETASALGTALALAEKDPRGMSRLGEGWVGEEALAMAVHAALTGSDFADVIRRATNHDGDSDSTASIAAQIYGARHGLAGLPQRWVRRLDLLEPLLVVAHDLVAAGAGRPTLRSYGED